MDTPANDAPGSPPTAANARLGQVLTFSLALYYKLTGQKDFVQTPLPGITAMFFIIGVLMILLGVLAEMLMRTYFESQGKRTYNVRRSVNVTSLDTESAVSVRP